MKKFVYGLFAFLALTAPANQTIFSTTTSVTATTTSTLALAANNLRTYLLVQNLGSVSVYIKFGSAQAGNGITIPAGGNYEPILAPANAVYLESASSTASVKIIEGR